MKSFNVLLLIFSSILFISCSEEDLKIDNTISSLHVSTGELYPAFNPAVKDYYITS